MVQQNRPAQKEAPVPQGALEQLPKPEVALGVEQEPAVETAAEQPAETESKSVETPTETIAAPVAAPAPTTPDVAKAPELEPDRLYKAVESILEEDLTDTFLAMPPDLQMKFKDKGEETAGKIREMLDSAKVSTKKVFDLIKDWLKMIPGVNKFFLEQEAKIKTDKILFARDEQRKREQGL